MRWKYFHRALEQLDVIFALSSAEFNDGEVLLELLNAQSEPVLLVRATDKLRTFHIASLASGLISAQSTFSVSGAGIVELRNGPTGTVITADKEFASSVDAFDSTCIVAIRYSEKIKLHSNAFDLGFLWRRHRRDSGFPCDNYAGNQIEKNNLRPGLSFIIRAKNEAQNVEQCLKSLSPYLDEVIFVDNDSSDNTLSYALAAQKHYYNLHVHSYPIKVPRAGAEHAAAVLQGIPNTLGHYYNFCLSKSSRFNFVKWDADYIALKDNLEEMIQHHMLRTRGDNFSLWFSGLEVLTDGKNFWLDTQSRHSEWRAFSKLYGQKWTNLLPWEEIEQSYIYASNKAAYFKPVYVELFYLEDREFSDRGVFTDDIRDAERLAFIDEYKKTGTLSDLRFEKLDGLDLNYLAQKPLSSIEIGRGEDKMVSFAQVPQVQIFDRVAVEKWSTDQLHYIVLIFSCEKNRARKAWMENTWVKDFVNVGVPVFFVYGRPGQPSCLVGNEIFLNVEDNYENLIIKICEAFKFVRTLTGFSHIIKVDDDICLNLAGFEQLSLRGIDYTGGRLIFSGARLDWHMGKCENKQLDHLPVVQRKPQSWFDGGSTYCLSARAVDAVLERTPDIFCEMYEDQAIAAAVSDHPELKIATVAAYRGYKMNEQALTGGVIYVGDIVSEAQMSTIYNAIRGNSAFDEGYEINADWMDFEAVAAKLGLAAKLPETRKLPSIISASEEMIGMDISAPPPIVREIVVKDDYQHIRLDFGPLPLGPHTIQSTKIGIYRGEIQLILPPLNGNKQLTLDLGQQTEEADGVELPVDVILMLAECVHDLARFGEELPELVRTAKLHRSIVREFDQPFWVETATKLAERLSRALSRNQAISLDECAAAVVH